MFGRRLGLAAPAVLVLLAVSACGVLESPAAEGDPPSESTSPTPRPAPSTTGDVVDRVGLAKLDLSDFHPETRKPTDQNDDPWKLAKLCETPPSDVKRTAHHEWLWEGEVYWIRHYVVGYLTVEGATLLAELRDGMRGCTSYQLDGTTYRVLKAPPPPDIEGTDIVTYCERSEGGGVPQCTAVISRGHFVTQIDVARYDVAEDRSLEAAQKALRQLIPLTAEALAKAG